MDATNLEQYLYYGLITYDKYKHDLNCFVEDNKSLMSVVPPHVAQCVWYRACSITASRESRDFSRGMDRHTVL